MGVYLSTNNTDTDTEHDNSKQIVHLKNSNTLLRELLKAETEMRKESQMKTEMLEKTVEKYKSLYYELCKDSGKKSDLNWD